MLDSRFLIVLLCFICCSCSKEESGEKEKATLTPEIVSITPASAVQHDTIAIKLKNAVVSNFLR